MDGFDTALNAAEYNAMGKTLYQADKFEEALGYYQKAEEADINFRETYLNQGECLIMLDRFEDAEAAYNKALLLDKHDGELYFHLGNVWFLMDDEEKGRQFYAKAINEGYDDPQLYFSMGVMYLNGGYVSESIEQFNKAISRDRFFADAWLHKAKAYLQKGMNKDALKVLDGMIEHVPEVFEGHHYKAMVLMRERRFPEAQAALDKAVRMFPDDESLWFDQQLLLEAQGKPEEALLYYDAHFAGSDSPLHLFERAKLLSATKGREDEGYALHVRLADCDDNDIARDSRFHAAMLDMGAQRFQAAVDGYSALINTELRDDAYYSALYFLGVAHQKLGDRYKADRAFKEANRMLRMACSLEPGAMDNYVLRAMSLIQLNENEKALELANYMLSAAPELPEALMIRSEVYKRMHEPEKAEADRQAAMAKGGGLSDIMALVREV